MELQLEPKNLGRVQVEMTWDQEGALHVSMYAENSRTRALLEQDLAGLRSVLSQNTQQEVRVEVSRQQESQQQNFYDGESGGSSTKAGSGASRIFCISCGWGLFPWTEKFFHGKEVSFYELYG